MGIFFGVISFIIGLLVGWLGKCIHDDVYCDNGEKHSYELVSSESFETIEDHPFDGNKPYEGPGNITVKIRRVYICSKCGYKKTEIE